MMHYSLQPRDRTFVKGYVFLSYAKNIGKDIGKNVSKKWIVNIAKKLLHHAKQSAANTQLQKAETTGSLIGNKIANKIMKVSNTSQQNNSKPVTNEHNKKNLKKDIYLYKKDRKLLMM